MIRKAANPAFYFSDVSAFFWNS